MYLRIKNFEKILEAPHPLYTCIGCNEKENTYIIDIAGDNDNQIYTVSIDRNQDKRTSAMNTHLELRETMLKMDLIMVI